VGVAALAARSAFYGARLNVEINLAHIDDVAWVQDVEETMRGFPDIDGLERTVLEGVARSMKGEGG
jgi:formiminotetrahydrofolate cyclodeaminase